MPKNKQQYSKEVQRIFISRAKETDKTLNELKSGGVIKQTQKELFTIRLRIPGGRLSFNRLDTIAKVARKYGKGYVHLSVRQSIEIPYVNIKDLPKMAKELKRAGQEIASCGPRVRVPTACGGCEYNPNGILDTQKWCLEVDKRYFGTPTQHHKFKVTFAGCPMDCVRSREADLGFQGQVEPLWNRETCIECGLCAKACLEEAITFKNGKGKPIYKKAKCIYCGDCIKGCPAGAWRIKRKGWLVCVGGKHGRHPVASIAVINLLPEEKTLTAVEKVLTWYQKNGAGRERIGVTIKREGLSKFKKEVVQKLVGTKKGK